MTRSPLQFDGLMPMQLAMFCWFIGWLDCWLAACPSCCLLVQPALLMLVPLVRLAAAAVATTMQCGCGMQDAAETGHPTADCVTYEGHDRDMGCRPNGHAMLHEHDDWCNCQS